MSELSRLKTLQQERAKYAWQCISEVKDKALEEKYSSYVKKAPALIHRNGLGYTLAFYKSKGEEAYNVLYKHIDGWFKKVFNENKDILDWIKDENTTSLDVLRATREILAMLDWLKRFAEAELKSGAEA